MRVTVNVDGGARGNPGPSAAACVVRDADGVVLLEEAELLGEQTNNVAEYRALLLGLDRAADVGADEVHVIGDSELIVRQVRGEYKVKHAAMKPLHARALSSLARFAKWSIESVPRASNADADALVNQALDGQLSR